MSGRMLENGSSGSNGRMGGVVGVETVAAIIDA